MPDWFRTYQAAKLLGCPPWELEEREDGWWWENHAIIAANAEAKAQENQSKVKRKA